MKHKQYAVKVGVNEVDDSFWLYLTEYSFLDSEDCLHRQVKLFASAEEALLHIRGWRGCEVVEYKA